jgi:hypothetical protein
MAAIPITISVHDSLGHWTLRRQRAAITSGIPQITMKNQQETCATASVAATAFAETRLECDEV